MTNENDCGSTSLAEQDSEEASSYAEPPRSFDEGDIAVCLHVLDDRHACFFVL